MFPENLAYNYIIWKSKCYWSQMIWIIKIHINILSQNTAFIIKICLFQNH